MGAERTSTGEKIVTKLEGLKQAAKSARAGPKKLGRKLQAAAKKAGSKSKQAAAYAKLHALYVNAEDRWDRAGDKKIEFMNALDRFGVHFEKAHKAATAAVAKGDYKTALKQIDGMKDSLKYVKPASKNAAKYAKIEYDAEDVMKKVEGRVNMIEIDDDHEEGISLAD
jgi:hypothetical protein